MKIPKQAQNLIKIKPKAQDICKNCGHYYFLHQSNFKGECDACDTPEIKLENKCQGFEI